MHHFFTTESTAPPAISALWYSVMVLLIVTAIVMSLRYYQNEQFRKCFQYLQGLPVNLLVSLVFCLPHSLVQQFTILSLPLGHVCGLVFYQTDEKQNSSLPWWEEWSHLCFGLSSLCPSLSLILRAFFSSSDITVSWSILDLSLENGMIKPLKK